MFGRCLDLSQQYKRKQIVSSNNVVHTQMFQSGTRGGIKSIIPDYALKYLFVQQNQMFNLSLLGNHRSIQGTNIVANVVMGLVVKFGFEQTS